MKSEIVRGAAPRLLVPLPSGDGRRDARAMADVLRMAVPDLVGLSLVVRDDESGRPLTVAATGDDVALLDAVQYLTGGPGPMRPGTGWVDLRHRVAATRWEGLAIVAGAADVHALLVVGKRRPVVRGATDVVVHVYAGSPAPEQVDRVATALGSWLERAGDLRAARRMSSPDRTRAAESLDQQGDAARAVARLAVQQGIDVVAARAKLQDAAQRAGVPECRLAGLVARPNGRPHVRG